MWTEPHAADPAMSRRLELKPSEVLSKQNNPVTLIEFIHREGFFPPSDYTEIKHTTFTPPTKFVKMYYCSCVCSGYQTDTQQHPFQRAQHQERHLGWNYCWEVFVNRKNGAGGAHLSLQGSSRACLPICPLPAPCLDFLHLPSVCIEHSCIVSSWYFCWAKQDILLACFYFFLGDSL